MNSMTRREFGGTLAGAAAAAPAEKLNLVILTNDQHRADSLGCTGNPVVKTPVIDRLASEGVLFESHYVQCPQCVPSRSALHTGRYPHTNRTPTNLYQLSDREETLAAILNREGYRTATTGELPFAPTRFLGGFREVLPGGETLPPDMEALRQRHAENLKRDFQAVAAPWAAEFDETALFAGRAIEFLRAARARPFYLHVNFRRPHHPFDPPAPFDRMYDGATFPASHKRDGEMGNKPPGQRNSLENSVGFDLRTMTARDLDRIKSYYYGMISLNDLHIGRILDELERLALDRRTVVAFNADHGEMLGDHGLLFKGGYFYDEVVRAPLILRAPGLPAARRVGDLVETVDLLPTLLDLLGLPASGRVQGRSLLPVIAGKDRRPRAAHSEFPNMKMIRTRDWKLVHYLRASYGELYNLTEDPGELYNRWDDAACAGAKSEMQARLADWLVDTEDPALAPLKAG
jgi:arylsulfatase A-like enzyme